MPRFTDEQMKEIDAARGRMEAYCDKGKFYPALPEEAEPEPRPIIHKHFYQEINNESLKIAKRLDQVERANKYLLVTLKERSSGKKDKV